MWRYLWTERKNVLTKRGWSPNFHFILFIPHPPSSKLPQAFYLSKYAITIYPSSEGRSPGSSLILLSPLSEPIAIGRPFYFSLHNIFPICPRYSIPTTTSFSTSCYFHKTLILLIGLFPSALAHFNHFFMLKQNEYCSNINQRMALSI